MTAINRPVPFFQAEKKPDIIYNPIKWASDRTKDAQYNNVMADQQLNSYIMDKF
jgi:uncharacterized protein YbaA (DUF1428 family)